MSDTTDMLDLIPDDYDYGEITCNRCGAEGLGWVHTGVRWRLMDEAGKFHTCGPVASADDFEVVE